MLAPHELQMLLWNINPAEVSVSEWRRIKKNKLKTPEKT